MDGVCVAIGLGLVGLLCSCIGCVIVRGIDIRRGEIQVGTTRTPRPRDGRDCRDIQMVDRPRARG